MTKANAAVLQAEAAETAWTELAAWTAGGPLTRALRAFFKRGGVGWRLAAEADLCVVVRVYRQELQDGLDLAEGTAPAVEVIVTRR